MGNNKSSLSQASSYEEIGEFWDSHDATDFWDQTHPVEMEFDLKAEESYYPVARDLAHEIETIAHSQGVSSATLINLWLQEKVHQAGS
jgi:hypothetical protein